MEVVLGLYRVVSNPYFVDTDILLILARASSFFINYSNSEVFSHFKKDYKSLKVELILRFLISRPSPGK